MILGIDFGGSSIKQIEAELSENRTMSSGTKSSVMKKQFIPYKENSTPLAYLNSLQLEKYSHVICTGGRSMSLPDQIDGNQIHRVHEFEAVTQYVSDQYKLPCLVASLGTGIPFLSIDEDGYQHVGGTSLGGGTIQGLGRMLTDVSSFEELTQLATQGDSTSINLTVGDIVGSGIGYLPAEASASYFAKLDQNDNKEDIAAALVQMVAESISVLASQIMEKLEMDSLIAIGRMASSPYFTDIIGNIFNFYNRELIIAEDPAFATIRGAISKTLPNLAKP